MPQSGHRDITEQDFFEQVIAGNENRVRVIAKSHRVTGVFPPRLGLLTVGAANGQSA
jgi:hypothetical protein